LAGHSIYNRYNLDTFYGTLSRDGRTIGGSYVDTGRKKGIWSVSKVAFGTCIGRLFIKTEPVDVRIRILNIVPKFYQGIKLDPRRYHIEVSAKGFETKKTWIEIGAGDIRSIDIRLTTETKTFNNRTDKSSTKKLEKQHRYDDKNIPLTREEQKTKQFFEEIFNNAHKLRFFERGTRLLQKIRYKRVFRKSTTRYISYELKLKHKSPGLRIKVPIEAVYKKSNGTIFARFTNNSYVEQNWVSSKHSLGNGWKNPGNWSIDSYKVELYVKDKKIASGSFRVIK